MHKTNNFNRVVLAYVVNSLMMVVATTETCRNVNYVRTLELLSVYYVYFDVFLERNKRTGHGEKDTTMNYVHEIFNEPNIVNYIKVKRLAWAGHLVRMK